MTVPFFVMHSAQIVNSHHEFEVPPESSHRAHCRCEGIQKSTGCAIESKAIAPAVTQERPSNGLRSGSWLAARDVIEAVSSRCSGARL